MHKIYFMKQISNKVFKKKGMFFENSEIPLKGKYHNLNLNFCSRLSFMRCTSLAHESLNKDPTVWLDGASPANTCIPPYFP